MWPTWLEPTENSYSGVNFPVVNHSHQSAVDAASPALLEASLVLFVLFPAFLRNVTIENDNRDIEMNSSSMES